MLRARFALYTAERDRCTGIPLEPSAATGPMVDRTRSIVVDFVQCLFRGEHMTPVLYYFPPSPPCRTLLLLGRLLGLEFELRVVDVLQGEQLKPDFVKLNPQHIIPTVDHHGLVLWESRAIMTYLVSAFANEDTLYPKDIRVRALVDQRIQFDLGTLYARMGAYFFPTMFDGAPLDDAKRQQLADALAIFDVVLKGRTWSAADHFTVADLTLLVTVSQLEGFGFDLGPYKRVQSWLIRCKNKLEPFGYEEINQNGVDMMAAMLRANMVKA